MWPHLPCVCMHAFLHMFNKWFEIILTCWIITHDSHMLHMFDLNTCRHIWHILLCILFCPARFFLPIMGMPGPWKYVDHHNNEVDKVNIQIQNVSNYSLNSVYLAVNTISLGYIFLRSQKHPPPTKNLTFFFLSLYCFYKQWNFRE